MSLFRREKRKLTRDVQSILDDPILIIPGTTGKLSARSFIEGSLVCGQTGSGKSSGPAKHIALAMLKAGYGFVVLCVKPEERQIWEGYAAKTGRSQDLVIFNENSSHQFNMLEYEMQRSGRGAGETLNLVNMLMSLNEQIQIHQGGSQSGDDEKFWDLALRRALRQCIELLKLAGEPVNIVNMEQLMADSFGEHDLEAYQMFQHDLRDNGIPQQERENIYRTYKSWVAENYFLYVLEKIESQNEIAPNPRITLHRAKNYWLNRWPLLSEKTKSIVTETFMGLMEPFSSGILQSHFSEGLSPELYPENSFLNHKIIIIDFPVKSHGLSGIYASTLYKTTFQLSAERREVSQESNPKPVTLFIDEYQNLVSPLTDSLFQLTARSSWVCSVFVTQNINNLKFVMGKSMPEARTKSLLGNLNVKIFCANSDYDTNYWAAQMIGQHFIDKSSVSLNAKKEKSETLDQMLYFRVAPEYFSTLKTGSPIHNHRVEAVVFIAGKKWDASDVNFAVAEFHQNPD